MQNLQTRVIVSEFTVSFFLLTEHGVWRVGAGTTWTIGSISQHMHPCNIWEITIQLPSPFTNLSDAGKVQECSLPSTAPEVSTPQAVRAGSDIGEDFHFLRHTPSLKAPLASTAR